MTFRECRLSDALRTSIVHCTGYPFLFPIRRYAGPKWTSIAVDRLPAVNLLADNCRQSPIRRDEDASDYLNIQQPPVKRPSYCLCQKAVPTGPGPAGNLVFNASTCWWGDGLSAPPGYVRPAAHGTSPQGPDKRVQVSTANLLQRLAS